MGKFVVAAVIGCLLPLALAAQQGGGYLADARTGCKVWFDSLEYKKTVRWDGPCKDGFAHGAGAYSHTFLITHNTGSGPLRQRSGSVSGQVEFANGKMSGRAVLSDSDGGQTEGNFRDGKLDGRGLITTSTGSRWEGTFRNGSLHGRGFQTMGGEYAGERFDGEFVDGQYHGQGVYTWPDGRRLEARFEKGHPAGTGLYRDQTGRVVRGTFEYSCLYAEGKVIQLVLGGLTSICRSSPR